MPTVFDSQFLDQAVDALFEQFGEQVLYVPSQGRARLITAIINRQALQSLEPINDGVAPVLKVKALDQNTEQVSYNDLVIGSDPETVTSAEKPFDASAVGEWLRVTSGTGFTVGKYEVLSVALGVATLDREVGTALSTGGVATLGWGGIGATRLKPGHDKLRVAWRKYDTPKERTIVTLLGVNGGLTMCEVR